MFSAFKKLTNKNEVQNGSGHNGLAGKPGEGVHSMSHNLQKKFAKGCNYNMKIVIRGDKNTGKSCLLNRLQGSKFTEEYLPTEEIQVESINWSYKNTEDIVKVEVWDVVDVAKKRKKLTGLKVGNGTSEGEEFEPGLDAQFLDVYKQTHGAILIFDITKPWTFDYVKAEVNRIPVTIPVLVLANFVDQAHHRQVTKLQVADFIENLHRKGDNPAEVRWAECSLRNGFGLRFLHNFFNIPFLTLQRESLLRQLDQNTREIKATHDELDLYMESEAADYNKFSESLANRRRQAADQMAPAPTRSIIVGTNPAAAKPVVPAFQESSSSLSYSNRNAAACSTPPPEDDTTDAAPMQVSSLSISDAKTDSTNTKSKSPTPTLPSSRTSTGASVKPKEPSPTITVPTVKSGKVDVEDFVPDSGDFDNFLDDENTNSGASNVLKNGGGNLDSSEDEGPGNPMVSKFDEDVHFDEYDTGFNQQHNINRSDNQDYESL